MKINITISSNIIFHVHHHATHRNELKIKNSHLNKGRIKMCHVHDIRKRGEKFVGKIVL